MPPTHITRPHTSPESTLSSHCWAEATSELCHHTSCCNNLSRLGRISSHYYYTAPNLALSFKRRNGLIARSHTKGALFLSLISLGSVYRPAINATNICHLPSIAVTLPHHLAIHSDHTTTCRSALKGNQISQSVASHCYGTMSFDSTAG